MEMLLGFVLKAFTLGVFFFLVYCAWDYLSKLKRSKKPKKIYWSGNPEPVPFTRHQDIAESTAAPGLTQQQRAECMSRAVVMIRTYNKGKRLISGSGFVVDKRLGLIATNAHVINLKGEIKVTYIEAFLPNGEAILETTTATVVGVPSKEEDLALLQMQDRPDLPWAYWVTGTQPHYGMNAIGVGHPRSYSWTQAYGKVTHPARYIDIHCPTGFPYVQTDALCAHGVSGGALFDDDGHLIGVVTRACSEQYALGFARPTAALRNYLRHLRTSGVMAPRRVGLTQLVMSPYGSFDTSSEGDLLDQKNVTKGELLGDDVVVAVDGIQPLSNNHYLQLMWASTDGNVLFSVMRGDSIVQVEANIH